MTRRVLDTLAIRIAIGFMAMSLSVVALFAILSLALVERDLNAAAGNQQRAAVAAIGSALRTAYAEDNNWTTADLRPTVALAHAYGIDLNMRPRSRSMLEITANGAGGPSTSFDVTYGAEVVARVNLPQSSGLSPAEAGLRRTISTSIAITAVCAVILAVVGAALLGRRLARPLEELARAARRLGRGAKATRVGRLQGPREVHDLGAAFDAMADDLELEDQLRRAVTANVAHELRTPLSILQGETAALADGVVTWSPEVAKSFEEEVGRLARLVQDLSTLSAAEAAALTIERVPTRLDHVVVDACERLRRRFVDRRLDLRVRTEPTWVLGDADRLEQIVANLLLNAARYVPSGGSVDVVVSNSNEQANLTVQDNGPGIPSEERARIFDRFVRGSSSDGVPGSGVGLSVVRELVEAHDGSVRVDESFGGGSRFVVTLDVIAPTSVAGV